MTATLLVDRTLTPRSSSRRPSRRAMAEEWRLRMEPQVRVGQRSTARGAQTGCPRSLFMSVQNCRSRFSVSGLFLLPDRIRRAEQGTHQEVQQNRCPKLLLRNVCRPDGKRDGRVTGRRGERKNGSPVRVRSSEQVTCRQSGHDKEDYCDDRAVCDERPDCGQVREQKRQRSEP